MYNDREAVEIYSKEFGLPVDEIARSLPIFYPKSAFGIQPVNGIEQSVEQGLKFNRIAERPTSEQLAAAFDIVWVPEQK